MEKKKVIEWRWEVESWYRQKGEERDRSWDEEMDRRNDWKRESLARPELCDAFHSAAFLLCPLSPSRSFAVLFSATYALTTDSCSPWERDRHAPTRHDFKHSILLHAHTKLKSVLWMLQTLVILHNIMYFLFYHPVSYRLTKSCLTFSV